MNNPFEHSTSDIETAEQEHAFEQLLNSFEANKERGGNYIEYNLPYPKELFLKYLTEKKNFLLHGSGEDVSLLEPRQANDAHKASGNKTAVYAVQDPVLPIFYAIKDRRIEGRVISGKTDIDGIITYQFAMSKEALAQNPFKNGVVYILEPNGFSPEFDEGKPSSEWTADRAVQPWAKLKVSPEDFPHLKEVKSF